MPVIFDPDMACNLIQYYSSAFSSENVQKNQSFLTGKRNEVIASEKVTLMDDGLIPERIGTFPFDSEGNLPDKNTLISDGVCHSYLYDEKTALHDESAYFRVDQYIGLRKKPWSLKLN